MKTCSECSNKEIHKSGRCRACHNKKKWNKEKERRAAIRKKEYEAELKDPKLGKTTKICSYCLKRKYLTEYSTTRDNRKGRLKKMCDCCLSKQKTDTRYDDFNYAYWRQKAYSINTTERNKLRRDKDNKSLTFDDIDFMLKPQHLVEMYNDQKGYCHYCEVKLKDDETHVDHKTPLSCEGKHELLNLVLSCADCNFLKHKRTEQEFRTFIKEYVQRFQETQDKEPV